MCIYIYIYIYDSMYIYIYIHIYTLLLSEREVTESGRLGELAGQAVTRRPSAR